MKRRKTVCSVSMSGSLKVPQSPKVLSHFHFRFKRKDPSLSKLKTQVLLNFKFFRSDL